VQPLTVNIADQIQTACETNVQETGASLTRALDQPMTVAVGEICHLSPGDLPSDLEGPGLAILMQFEKQGIVAVISQSSGLLPDWYRAPDATGTSKLTTLAQELAMLVIPEQMVVKDFRAAHVPSLAASLRAAELSDPAGAVDLSIDGGDKHGKLHVIWPVSKPAALFTASDQAEKADTGDEAASEKATESAAARIAAAAAAAQKSGNNDLDDPFDRLPNYIRSLLAVEVPVMVTLARKKQHVNEILELGVGSILKFDKSCDEALDLEVNGRPIARGEAVKVGDKFGLRLTSIILPEERFKTVRSPRSSAR